MGVEPTASGLQNRRSPKLSYSPTAPGRRPPARLAGGVHTPLTKRVELALQPVACAVTVPPTCRDWILDLLSEWRQRRGWLSLL